MSGAGRPKDTTRESGDESDLVGAGGDFILIQTREGRRGGEDPVAHPMDRHNDWCRRKRSLGAGGPVTPGAGRRGPLLAADGDWHPIL